MQKSDWIWLAIRVFGLYMLVLAIIALGESLYASVGAWLFADSSSEGLREWGEQLRPLFARGVFSFVAYGVTGFYLVRKGVWLHRMLLRPDDLSRSVPPQDRGPTHISAGHN